MQKLRVQALTREAFARYGDVIEAQGAPHFTINEGNAQRYNDLARVDVAQGGGRPALSIFRAKACALPVTVRMLERHPLASQAFIPLRQQRLLIVVAAPGDTPENATLHAFYSTGTQGVNYAAGVWHHPLIALPPGGDFLVIDRAGPGENCNEFGFAEALTLEFNP